MTELPKLEFDMVADYPVPGMIAFRNRALGPDEDRASIPARQLRGNMLAVREVRDWCVEQFGPGGAKSSWDHSAVGVFFFDNQNDAFHFRMRWC